MASVVWDQSPGINYRDDPSTGAAYYTLTAFVQDLAPGSTAQLFAQALSMMPAVGNPGPIGNTVVYCRNPEASPPFDCTVRIDYGPPIAGSLFGPVKWRLGTCAEMSETEFDADNQILPFEKRKPIVVRYNPNGDTVPPPPANKKDPYAQGGRVPFYAPKSTATATATLRYNPGPLSRKYACKTNSTEWLGEAPGTVLCLGIEGESSDGEISFKTDFNFFYDPLDGFMQYLRWIDYLSGKPPELTIAKVKNRNGIQDIKVQGQEDFNNLPLRF